MVTIDDRTNCHCCQNDVIWLLCETLQCFLGNELLGQVMNIVWRWHCLRCYVSNTHSSVESCIVITNVCNKLFIMRGLLLKSILFPSHTDYKCIFLQTGRAQLGIVHLLFNKKAVWDFSRCFFLLCVNLFYDSITAVMTGSGYVSRLNEVI